MTDQEIFALDKAFYMPVFSRYPLVLTHGEGVYAYDTKGKRYIDFLGGIAVNVLGHAHPALVQAICEQAGKMIHCSNLYYTEAQARLAKRLVELSGLGKVFLANSGAEANEGAMKLARKRAHKIAPDKSEVISANHCFHGRTLATLTATAQPKYQQGVGPLPEGFRYVPYNDAAALEKAMSERTCAVLLEPIQGEGGVNVPDADYLRKVRALCDHYQAAMILDEIQTGVGRTGTMFAYEASGIKPDIVTLAKGLAGGVPVGAFIASDAFAEAFHPGDHGSTFGGNPLACAAANCVLRVIEQEGLLKNAQAMGGYLMKQLRALQEKYPDVIKDVRGRGLIVGAELSLPGREIADACLSRGVIINCTAGNVLRFVPPLIVKETHIDEMIAVLGQTLADLFKK